MDFENIAFFAGGGIGKNIAATIVARNLKKAFPEKKLLVMASHPIVWENNPSVDKIFPLGNALHFYSDFIKNEKTRIIDAEPYRHIDYVYKKRHLADVWCEMAGVKMDELKPELFLTKSELEIAMRFAKSEKPLMLMQSSGGPGADNENNQVTRDATMYKRNLPIEIAQEVVDEMSKSHRIVLIRFPSQPGLKGTETPSTTVNGQPSPVNPRNLIALIPFAEKMLFIDSFMQHAAAALNKKAVVCWGGTSPTALGYAIHNNIAKKTESCKNPFCHRPNSYLFDFTASGKQWECPQMDDCMGFPAKDIMEALK